MSKCNQSTPPGCRAVVLSVVLLLGGLAMPVQADYQIWFQNSTVKVFQDDPPGGTAGVRLTAARQETEAASTARSAVTLGRPERRHRPTGPCPSGRSSP